MTDKRPLHLSDGLNCVFCDLLVTGDALWVAREDHAVAFLPLPEATLAPGHTLVAPRVHSVGILDTDDVPFAAVMGLVRRVSRCLVEGLGADGVVVLNASGPASGQSVDHLHFHVVPCWHDDQATFWPADRSAHVVANEPAIHDQIGTTYQALYRHGSGAYELT